jgi:GEVED domain
MNFGVACGFGLFHPKFLFCGPCGIRSGSRRGRVPLSSRFDSILKECLEMTRRGLSILSLCLALTVPAFAQYCASSTTGNACGIDEYIANVTCGGMNNSSACIGPPSYEDFTGLTGPLCPPTVPTPITVTIGTFWSGDEVDVFCDWDGNFILNDPGEHFPLVTAGGVATGNITAPGTALPSTRMRVVLRYFGVASPCATTTFGNTEDYTVLSGGTPNCYLWFTSPLGPGSLQMDNTPCAPVAGADYINAITLTGGTFPNGWFFGLDISWGQLLSEFQGGYPFAGTLDGAGSSTFFIPGGAPSGLQLWAVSAQFAPGFGPFLYNRPAVTYTIP